MTSHALSRQYGLFLTGGRADIAGKRLRKTLIVSLVIHLCILALIAGFRLRKTVERPLSAVQVSLVAPPTQETAKTEPRVEKVRPSPKPAQAAPIPVPPKPVQPPTQAKPTPVEPSPPPMPAPVVTQPAPPMPTLVVPQPIPQSVKSSPSAPVLSRKDVMQDLLKDIELPHNLPKFGDMSPAKPAESKKAVQAKLERTQELPQNDFDALIKKLKVPENTPQIEAPKEQVKPVPVPPKLPSLSEELDRELKELKSIQAPPTVKLPDAVREAKPMFREPPRQVPPPVTASVPKVKTPDAALKVAGMVTGSNPYLARVQARISSFWTPVDAQSMQDEQLSVMVRFRLHRSGKVSDVIMERPSGNEYFDLAARRAILS
ncbi:MAG: energy transducer TonB, partial [Nitrospiraceae bacterium]